MHCFKETVAISLKLNYLEVLLQLPFYEYITKTSINFMEIGAFLNIEVKLKNSEINLLQEVSKKSSKVMSLI